MCALGALFRLDSTILSSLPLATSSSIYQDYDVLKADLIAALNRNRHCHIVSKRVDPIDIVASIHWVLQNEKLSNSLHCNWLAFEPAFGRLLELIVSTVYPELSSSMDIEDNSGATATGSGKFLINIASVYRGKDVVAGDSQVCYQIIIFGLHC